MNKIDNVIPTSKWSFSDEVAKCFGNMLSRSIPDYDTMRTLTNMLGFSFVRKGGYIIDIGCSNGLGIEPFVKKYGEENRYILIDTSVPMVEECKRKYKDLISDGIVDVRAGNVCKEYPNTAACLVLSILTVQFTPIEYRQKILTDIFNSLENGGALVFVEKVLGTSYETDKMLVSKYYDIKRINGYTEEQIQAKRKSLEGVLVPITAEANESMLYKAGFKRVECFWRCLNFCGWIAIKE